MNESDIQAEQGIEIEIVEDNDVILDHPSI